MSSEYDYIFKVIAIGNSSAGKSSILTQFTDNIFNGESQATIGIDLKIKTIDVVHNNIKRIVKLIQYDSAGQDRFRCITTSYYRAVHSALIVYDITDKYSFDCIEKIWIPELDKYAPTDIIKVLVGNKTDTKNRIVSTMEGNDMADRHNMLFIETSAKTGEGINALFHMIASKLIDHHIKTMPIDNSKKNINISGKSLLDDAKNKCC